MSSSHRPTLSPSAHTDTFARDHLPPADQWPTLEFTTDLLQYPDRLNAATELIDVPVERFGPDRVAFRTPSGETWTYGQVQRTANQVAQVLTEDLGVVPGSRVLLRSPNTPWTVVAWLGALKAGAVVVTTMAALRATELTPIIERTQPRVALADHRVVDELETVRRERRPEMTVLSWGDGTGLEELAAAKSGEFTNVETAADDVALFCPTSGSTGVPKITTHFHRDVLSIDNTFGRQILGLVSDDLVACTAPLAFTFGLGMLVVFPLRVGAAALLTEPMSPLDVAEQIAEHGVTALATAPTAYKAILASGRAPELLHSVRVAVSAGEHIPQATWEGIRDELGLKIIDGIGATEMLHIFISAAGDEIRPGTTGKPVPGYRATILDETGQEVGAGVKGRLAVIGPVGCRYLDDERQALYVVGGWNLTGDTFERDEDGYFHYCARTDNMIVSSGYNIGGPEVEEAISRHPDVVECAVVGRPDKERGTVVCAFIVLREGVEGEDTKRREIQDFVKQEIAPYKYPRDVRFVTSLPRNPSGKLQHFRLRRQLEQEAAE